MLNERTTRQYRKDLRQMQDRKKNLEKLLAVINMLKIEETLPEQYRDHALTGNWAGYRECHIEPDWLLIYRIENAELILVLTRTGSHSDLF